MLFDYFERAWDWEMLKEEEKEILKEEWEALDKEEKKYYDDFEEFCEIYIRKLNYLDC